MEMETDLDVLRDQILIVFKPLIPTEDFYQKMHTASLILVQRSDLRFKITKNRYQKYHIEKLSDICPSLIMWDDHTIEMDTTDLAKLRLLWN